jgi:hypothetical protein
MEQPQEKTYTWSPDDMIPVRGKDFEIILQTARLIYTHESGEAKVFANAIVYHTTLQNLKEAVERALQGAIQGGHVTEQVEALEVTEVD